ncbi:MAG: LamG domain-containing protein, partial [Kangiellaceae bacterium]
MINRNKLTNKFSVATANSALTAAILIFLSACSGGGAEVEETPVAPPPPTTGYSGPPPATDDVQAFKLNVWDNLYAQNRCGQCHGTSQEPDFVNLEDINIAYAKANTIVDLTSPKDSRMVTKVADGHNC